VRITLSNARFIHDLILFYRRIPGCLVFQVNEDSVDVFFSEPRTHAEEQRLATAYYEAWAAAHPELNVRFA
jgi:hypothetical protein